jgi:uncharacterized protein (DUF2267 family)
MSTTGFDVFDHAIQEANIWMNGLEQKLLPGTDRHTTYRVLRAVLHALRDRLPAEQAAHLGGKMPMIVRGVYFENWPANGTPSKERHKAAFLAHVGRELKGFTSPDLENAVYAVVQLLCERIDPGEIAKFIGVMPAELRDLFEPPVTWDATYRRRTEAS